MNLIYQGLQQRTEDVTLIISRDEEVKLAQSEFDACLKKMIEKFGDDDLFSLLDETFNNLSYWECHATYRIALADGMQLQQEINALATPIKEVVEQ